MHEIACNICFSENNRNILTCVNECSFRICLICYNKMERSHNYKLCSDEFNIHDMFITCPQCKQGYDTYIFPDLDIAFIGETKDKLPNGHGILEFHDSDFGFMTFECEMVNGVINGTGKITFQDDTYAENVFLDKDYLIQGDMKIFDVDGDVVSDGFYVDGEIKFGKEYNKNTKYVGTFLDGSRHGFGSLYEDDVLVYCGDWDDGVREGTGIEFDILKKQTYRGTFKNNKYDGFGILNYNMKNYRGEFENGAVVKGILNKDEDEYLVERISGNYVTIYNEGNVSYIGNIRVLDKAGYGKEYHKNGKIKHDGIFLMDDFRNGSCYTEYGTLFYEGDMMFGKRHGIGKLRCTLSKQWYYNGGFDYDKFTGFGTFTYNNGIKLSGFFSKNYPFGKISIYNTNSEIIYTVMVAEHGRVKNCKYKDKNNVLQDINFEEHTFLSMEPFVDKLPFVEYLKLN